MEKHSKRIGSTAALTSFILTLITFTVAVLTPPLSGPWCKEGCYSYPYLDITSRFPRDYYWMYLAMALNIVLPALSLCIHYYSGPSKKIYSSLAVIFMTVAATVLNIDYFLQVSVVQPSLLAGETDGLALLTQYNAHGIFIVLEEFGYFMMSFAFLCAAAVFDRASAVQRTVRGVFITAFVLLLAGFILINIHYGIRREYIFEIAAISINWLALIIVGIPLFKILKRSAND